MKLIIDIGEKDYKGIISHDYYGIYSGTVSRALYEATKIGKPLQAELEEINLIAYEIVGAEIRRIGLDMYNSKDERAEDFRQAYNLINECCDGIFNKRS